MVIAPARSLVPPPSLPPAPTLLHPSLFFFFSLSSFLYPLSSLCLFLCTLARASLSAPFCPICSFAHLRHYRSFGKRFLVLAGSKTNPKLHYFNGHESKEQCHGTLALTNAMVEEMEEKFTFQILNEDQQEGGEPTRWVLRCDSSDAMQDWISTITRVASIRRVVRLAEPGNDNDDESSNPAELDGGTEQTTLVARPSGTAAVLQRVFGEDAGAKASSNMQRHNQILLPKVPNNAKLSGRVTESEQLRVDIVRQLLPSYFNLVRRNMTDGVPKTIMLCLVNEVKEQMQNACLDVLYKRDENTGKNYVDSLLQEDEGFLQQKQRCQDFLKLLGDAAKVVREVQGMSVG